MIDVKGADISEMKKPDSENYKDIKPSSDMTANEARDFIGKDLFGADNINNNIEEPTKYYDDNGVLYREGNDLLPNAEYTINGYTYNTDEFGRIISAEGQLHMKTHEGRLPIRDSKADIGKGDERPTDDRGHLIADQFDGANGLENIVPQDANINQNDYRLFELDLAKEVQAGKDVRVLIEPVYEENSHRPDAIVVTYSIDGEQNMRFFPNGEE